jgi:hypothetical protein
MWIVLKEHSEGGPSLSSRVWWLKRGLLSSLGYPMKGAFSLFSGKIERAGMLERVLLSHQLGTWGTSPLSGSNDGVVFSSRLCDYSGGLGWSGSLGDSIGSILLHYRFQSLKSISLPPPWLALQGRINRKAWAPRAVCAVSVGEGSKWL